ncbi:hypothetical protein R84B8_00778 [Treponema sp. R8-4-B8]
MDKERKLKDEIIKFVQDSSEDVNSNIAVFIAGMKAQKNLTDNCQKTDNGFTIVKNSKKK